MAIAKPGKVLLHKIPLHFVHEKVAGGGKKGVDQSIPLVPFIDFLITLVVFLLMSFSASGELVAQQPSITMPTADHTSPLEVAPIISIDDRAVTLDGKKLTGDWQSSIVRNLSLAIPFFGLVVAYILYSRQGGNDPLRRLGDEWGKTRVVTAPGPSAI